MRKRPYIQHYIIELFDIDSDILRTAISLRSFAIKITKKIGLSVVEEVCCDFAPRGATLVFILSTSHISFHAWPEKNYLHIDLLACQELPTITTLRRLIGQIFKTKNYTVCRVNYDNDS